MKQIRVPSRFIPEESQYIGDGDGEYTGEECEFCGGPLLQPDPDYPREVCDDCGLGFTPITATETPDFEMVNRPAIVEENEDIHGVWRIMDLEAGDEFHVGIETEDGYEWIQCTFVEMWGGVSPWGRTSDNEYKAKMDWYKIFVRGEQGRFLLRTPTIGGKKPGTTVELDATKHFEASIIVSDWDGFVQGGMGTPGDEQTDAFHEVPVIRFEENKEGGSE